MSNTVSNTPSKTLSTTALCLLVMAMAGATSATAQETQGQATSGASTASAPSGGNAGASQSDDPKKKPGWANATIPNMLKNGTGNGQSPAAPVAEQNSGRSTTSR